MRVGVGYDIYGMTEEEVDRLAMRMCVAGIIFGLLVIGFDLLVLPII